MCPFGFVELERAGERVQHALDRAPIGCKVTGFLSPRTVESHLYRIFPELDITSRGLLASVSASREPEFEAPAASTINLGGHVSEPTNSRPHHPVVVARQAQRAADVQLRIADAITAYAGSMPFVYAHVVMFTVWMLFIESSPWPTLTLIVSLEAIFLSTFVMIGQNRQAAFQQAKADHDFNEVELELKTNTQLTREIHALTAELHRRLIEETKG